MKRSIIDKNKREKAKAARAQARAPRMFDSASITRAMQITSRMQTAKLGTGSHEHQTR